MNRPFNLRLSALTALLALGTACSDSSGPSDTRLPSALNILRLAATAPPLYNAVDSFYARKGVDRELIIFFQNQTGGAGEEYLRLRVDAPTLLARPDGTPFAVDDSILIRVRVVDPARMLFEFEPAGLKFNPSVPAQLRIHYHQADSDLNDDGIIDATDTTLENKIAIWRQETASAPFVRLGSVLTKDLEEVETELDGFSRYAIAY